MKNNIRNFFTLFYILSIIGTGHAQQYYVVHTEGNIFNERLHKNIATGDTLNVNDTLRFASANSWSILTNSSQRIFVQSQTEDTNRSILSACLQVIQKENHPVLRKTNEVVSDLKKHFGGEQFVIIGKNYTLEIDPEAYPLDRDLCLLYRYEYSTRMITVKIPFSKQRITLNPDILYQYKNETFPLYKVRNTNIYYFNSVTNTPTLVTSIKPIWLDEAILKKELSVLKKVYSLQKISSEELNQQFLSYIKEVYGKTDEVYFMEWLKQVKL